MTRNQSNRPPGSYRHEQADRVNQPTVETSSLMEDDTRAPQPFTLSPPPPKPSKIPASEHR